MPQRRLTQRPLRRSRIERVIHDEELPESAVRPGRIRGRGMTPFLRKPPVFCEAPQQCGAFSVRPGGIDAPIPAPFPPCSSSHDQKPSENGVFPDGSCMMDQSDLRASGRPSGEASGLGDGLVPPDALPVLFSAAPSAACHDQRSRGCERQQEPQRQLRAVASLRQKGQRRGI